MFVNASMNLTPFMSQILGFIMMLQIFPGVWTAFGSICLFIGCSILAMTESDKVELARTPLIAKSELNDSIELIPNYE